MDSTFHVVGLGASGMGISALQEFLGTLPSHTNAAYIAVTHQKRDRESQFASIIAKSTSMPVVKVVRTTRIYPDHVYVIVEGTYLTIKNGFLCPVKRPETPLNEAIDILFCSLAANFKRQTVGIIFWGLGADGVKGITAIEKEGGFVIVQRPDDSRDSEMAQRAIDQDHPNVVSSVEDIGEHLLMYMHIREAKH